MPPKIKSTWDDNDVMAQSEILAYSQVRAYEDAHEKNEEMKILIKVASRGL